MTSRPWMPLYVADFLADTPHLDAAQTGAYLLLIMHYWQTGGLPDNDAALMRITRMTPAQWKREKTILAAFFHDGWRHKRIDSELAHAADVSSKRRASAQQKRSNSSANAPANAEQLDTHARGLSQSQSQPQSSLRSDNAREDEPDLRAEFEKQFWPAWPNKVGKPAAFKAFCKVRKAFDLTPILFGVDRYVAEKPGDRPWLNPATFLNQERFNDEPAAVAQSPPRAVNGFASLALEMAKDHAAHSPSTQDPDAPIAGPASGADPQADLLDAKRGPDGGFSIADGGRAPSR